MAVDEGKEMGFCLRGKDLKVRCDSLKGRS